MSQPNQRLLYRAADTVLRHTLRRLPPAWGQGPALSWGYRYRPPPRTMRLRSGMRFHYDGPDFIPLLLHYTGTFEPQVIDQIRKLVRPGDTVLDVGANIGFHTLECWRAVGRAGRVISIEASPAHAETVRRNLRLNRLPVHDVLNCAVGDHDGKVSLSLPPGGNEGMYGINAGSENAFTVPMRRIDDIVSVPSLALIKIDIEGSELGALQGAAETIRRHKPAILIELNETALVRCGASCGEVVVFLQSLGYSGRKISGENGCDEFLFTA